MASLAMANCSNHNRAVSRYDSSTGTLLSSTGIDLNITELCLNPRIEAIAVLRDTAHWVLFQRNHSWILNFNDFEIVSRFDTNQLPCIDVKAQYPIYLWDYDTNIDQKNNHFCLNQVILFINCFLTYLNKF